MNVLTQEELILIACWSGSRRQLVGSDQAIEEGTIALSHKVQSMIYKNNNSLDFNEVLTLHSFIVKTLGENK